MNIPDRLSWDLTPENLARYGLDPILPGEYVQLRHQALDQLGAAISLAGVKLVMSVRRNDRPGADLVFQRRSVDNIGGGWTSETLQLSLDTDQTAETGATGKGWHAMTFAPTDQDLLIASVGNWFYDLRAQFVDQRVLTLLRGRITIPAPRTLVAAFT